MRRRASTTAAAALTLAIVLAAMSEIRIAFFDPFASSAATRTLPALPPLAETAFGVGGAVPSSDKLHLLTENIVVKMYIKGSGNGKYLNHSRVIADTWGKDLVDVTGGRSSLTFLMDNRNYDAVEEIGSSHPWATVKHVNGTDLQGLHRDSRYRTEAYRGQRTKIRAVFEDAFSVDIDAVVADAEREAVRNEKGGGNSTSDGDDGFDWVCYMDDDMIVNVPRLLRELVEVHESCSPNCWIADRIDYEGKQPYAAGGWCMERSAASRIRALLHDNTDKELRWVGNDDVHFVRVVKSMRRLTSGLVPRNSKRWYCHDSRPIEAGDGQIKKASMNVVESSAWYDLNTYPRLELDYEANRTFIDAWLPTISVFHNRVDYDAYGIMTGKIKTC